MRSSTRSAPPTLKSERSTNPVPATQGEALGWAAGRLGSVGIRESRPESLALWGTITKSDPLAALRAARKPMSDDTWERFRDAVERRAEGEPLAYAMGTAGFRTLDLRVDRRVLIPRPETEGLVQRVLDWAEAEGRHGIVADIGTGSGCIALSLAVEGSFSRVIATDTSAKAMAVAADNAAAVKSDTLVDFRVGEFFEPVRETTLDAIVTNPPYVTGGEFEDLDDGVRLYEPRDALVSPENGMWHIRRILEDAMDHLNPGGLLVLEVDARRADPAIDIAGRNGWSAKIEKDVFDRPRYLLCNPAHGGNV
ncbi:MAG: peptide chain release factor N(5)-glutamine methyltransferase [Gemmatimonadetes bacterium]|nr:peptide chain release factor N(5)-glutamine methyltransferase [Gemmatimonadota bacterium]